jgi:hypothetical protein
MRRNRMADNHIVAGVQGLDDAVIHAKIAVTKAKNVRDDLLTQASLLADKVLLIKEEMKQLGYATFSGKDQNSRTRLTQIIQEHFTLVNDQSSLDAAVNEAKERLEAAQEHEQVELSKAKARQILERIEDLDNAAASCDMALKSFLKSYSELQRHCQTICAATGHPQFEITRVLSTRAVKTHFLSMTRVFDLGALSPAETARMTEVCAGAPG